MSLTAARSVAKLDSVFMSPAEWDAINAVIWLRGEHDISTIPVLHSVLLRAIGHDDADLTLDLSEVMFIDAATIGTIIRTREFLRFWSRSLSLRSPSRFARRVLELCDLADRLEPGCSKATISTRTATALGTWVAVPTAPAEPQDILARPKLPGRLLPLLPQATQTVA